MILTCTYQHFVQRLALMGLGATLFAGYGIDAQDFNTSIERKLDQSEAEGVTSR
jgi:hypothetical protein